MRLNNNLLFCDVNNQSHISYFNELFQIHEDVTLCKPCIINDGIIQISETSEQLYTSIFNKKISEVVIEKFVPASGAATRMFAPLTNIQIENVDPEAEQFLLQIEKMPFANLLESHLTKSGLGIKESIQESKWSQLIETLLSETGLSFLNKAKGLIPFHQYPNEVRTAFEEHLFDFSFFSKNTKKNKLHFTIQQQFQSEIDKLLQAFSKKHQLVCPIEYSIQNPDSDIPAMDDSGNFHHNADGSIFLRPAGHGALLQNLNLLDGDCVFIQNIDNIPNEESQPKARQKRQVMGGILLNIVEERNRLFHATQESNDLEILHEARTFLTTWFQCQETLNDTSNVLEALNKPIRICGMVKNTGEPGGGPFWVTSNGITSKQIIESAQVNKKESEQKYIFEQATHFNPVDLVCHFKDPLGEKYKLENYTNKRSTLLSEKIIFGKKSKIIELPGLWNGGMWNWNTVFIELPVSSFCPVKTVNDLLKPGHLFKSN